MSRGEGYRAALAFGDHAGQLYRRGLVNADRRLRAWVAARTIALGSTAQQSEAQQHGEALPYPATLTIKRQGSRS